MNKKQKKFLAVGSIAVVGVAAAGVYAGTLTPSTSAKAGAGAVDVQASCTSAATLTPGASTWNPTTSKFEYTTMRVTATLTSCTGQEATVNVYKVADGSGSPRTRRPTPSRAAMLRQGTSRSRSTPESMPAWWPRTTSTVL